MVFRKVGGALKSFGGKVSTAVGPLASFAKTHAPDVLELGTKVASMVPGAHQPFAFAANKGIQAFRKSLEGVPNEEVKQKLSDALEDNSMQKSKRPNTINEYGTPVNEIQKPAPAIIPKIAEALVNTYRTIGAREREADAFRKGKSVKRKLFKPKKKKKLI